MCWRRVQYPCVVKPLSLAASQGVIRANNAGEFEFAVERIRLLLSSPEIQAQREPGMNELLVEKYIPGKEVAVEGLLELGKLRVLAIFDKPDPLEGPYFEETIYVTPSRLPRRNAGDARELRWSEAQRIGFDGGADSCGVSREREGVWVLEVAPRPIGGLARGRFGLWLRVRSGGN